ncbi:sulfatase [candidate division KSB1 bacterium]
MPEIHESLPRRQFLGATLSAVGVGIAASLAGCRGRTGGDLPNILLAISDDQGRDDVGCYGNRLVATPTQDRLAERGVRFTHAFVASPQCSPNRSAIYSGKTPHTIGTGRLHAPMPVDEFMFTDALTKAGYKTCAWNKWHLGQDRFIGDPIDDPAAAGIGAMAQPFFYQLGYKEPHRIWKHECIYDIDDITVPSYLPDTPKVREDLAGYLSDITWMDNHLGRFIQSLTDAGIADNTIIIFAGDNGLAFPRAKGTLYDQGLLVPLIIVWPGISKPGTVVDELVSFVDLAPTILDGLGLPVPGDIQGRSLIPLLKDRTASVRDAVFAERNWHDHDDTMRSVRTARYKYIRNFMSDTPFLPALDIANGLTWKEIVRLRQAGTLPKPLDRFYADKPRPTEELYDLESDPREFDNLADQPRLAEVKSQLRNRLRDWMADTGDDAELIAAL